jgi:hypothetical protein
VAVVVVVTLVAQEALVVVVPVGYITALLLKAVLQTQEVVVEVLLVAREPDHLVLAALALSS